MGKRLSNNSDIEGLAGVLIWTDAGRYDAMRSFYIETLGLTLRSDRAGFVNFAWGTQRLSVSVHLGVSGTARDSLRIMVNFDVRDIQAVYARLSGLGVAFSRAPEREEWGGWVATFADPDGNTLQLLQLPG